MKQIIIFATLIALAYAAKMPVEHVPVPNVPVVGDKVKVTTTVPVVAPHKNKDNHVHVDHHEHVATHVPQHHNQHGAEHVHQHVPQVQVHPNVGVRKVDDSAVVSHVPHDHEHAAHDQHVSHVPHTEQMPHDHHESGPHVTHNPHDHKDPQAAHHASQHVPHVPQVPHVPHVSQGPKVPQAPQVPHVPHGPKGPNVVSSGVIVAVTPVAGQHASDKVGQHQIHVDVAHHHADGHTHVAHNVPNAVVNVPSSSSSSSGVGASHHHGVPHTVIDKVNKVEQHIQQVMHQTHQHIPQVVNHHIAQQQQQNKNKPHHQSTTTTHVPHSTKAPHVPHAPVDHHAY